MIRGFSLYAVIYIIVIQLLQLVTSPVWRLMLATISLFWTYTMVQFITQSTPFTMDTVGTSRDLATVHFIWVSVVIVYHYICYSVSNSYWARSMYAVTVKPMCSLINTVLQLIRHLVCSCLFAREHNISGNEKSNNHAKPRQNRGV